jgi:hypothetical protein
MKQDTSIISTSGSVGNDDLRLHEEIECLRYQVDELKVGLRNLKNANMELAKDMQVIFESLSEVVNIMQGPDSLDTLFYYNNLSKDDLPN